MTLLDSLKEVLPVPREPVELPSLAAWDRVETSLGLVFPYDLRDLVSTYGTGCIDAFLWIHNPATSFKTLDFDYSLWQQVEVLRLLVRENINVPYRFYPDRNGLVPWATTDNSDKVYWIATSGKVKTVVWSGDAGLVPWQEFDLTPVEFLLMILKREVHVRAFPDVWPVEGSRHMFYPVGEPYLHDAFKRI